MLNFVKFKESVKVPVKLIRSVFDSRANASVDHDAAMEMFYSGNIGNVKLTADYVEWDGRTSKLAQLIRDNNENNPDALVTCDIYVGLVYDAMNKVEISQLKFRSLRVNCPEPGKPKRIYAKQDDMVYTTLQTIALLWDNGLSKSARKVITDGLDFLNPEQARKVARDAENSHRSSLICEARQLMADEHIGDLEAANRVGLETANGIVPKGGKTKTTLTRTLVDLRHEHNGLTRAMKDNDKAGKDLFAAARKETRKPLPAKTILNWLSWNDKKLNQLVLQNKDMTERIQREVAAKSPRANVT